MTEKIKEYSIGMFKMSLTKKLGSGSFGDIFFGKNTKTEDEVAIKVEQANTKPLLPVEKDLLLYLKEGVGIPKVHYFLATKDYNFMIIDLLGPSLEDIFNHFDRKLNKMTLIRLAVQMISRLEFLHSRYIIHRDVKPDNFLIGIKENKNTCYIVDFGLSKHFRDLSNGEHIKYRENKSLTGTARYASINTHLGVEQSRRDDLECLGYTIVYLYSGTLPWKGIKANNNKEKYMKICDMKISLTPYKLCKGFPKEFLNYFEYVRGLIFEETPDYKYLRGLFEDLLKRNDLTVEGELEWNSNEIEIN